MNKKQQLVSELTERLDKAGVVNSASGECGETQLYAPTKFWEQYPEGHCNSMVFPSVEGLLSCLNEKSLQSILDAGSISVGAKFQDLWKRWGQAGYFKCEPEILHKESVPILRLRHDCYLHWFRGIGFQNSHDAYCNGSNGSSGNNFPQARRAMTLPAGSSFRDDDDYTTDFDAIWNDRWALFRKAMFISYPINACAGKYVFHWMLETYPAIFEEFINLTDAQAAHVDLKSDLTLAEIREQCTATVFQGPTVLEIPMVCKCGRKDELRIYGILRFSESHVGFTWSANKEPKQFAIAFPGWELDAWMAEAMFMDLNCETPTCLSKRDYIYECWVDLAATLLTLAGVDCGSYWAEPVHTNNFDYGPVLFVEENKCAQGMKKVWDLCYQTVRVYPGTSELKAQVPTYTE